MNYFMDIPLAFCSLLSLLIVLIFWLSPPTVGSLLLSLLLVDFHCERYCHCRLLLIKSNWVHCCSHTYSAQLNTVIWSGLDQQTLNFLLIYRITHVIYWIWTEIRVNCRFCRRYLSECHFLFLFIRPTHPHTFIRFSSTSFAPNVRPNDSWACNIVDLINSYINYLKRLPNLDISVWIVIVSSKKLKCN